MTNIDTITDEQIEALRSEAGSAGDSEMVAICDRALAGDQGEREECARVIADVEAMESISEWSEQ